VGCRPHFPAGFWRWYISARLNVLQFRDSDLTFTVKDKIAAPIVPDRVIIFTGGNKPT
jgi:hypothetical protein